MRLKIIGIYCTLILVLGAGIWYVLNLKLSDRQIDSLHQSADKAASHAQAALEAQGLEIVALASRAASVPIVGQILDQWHKVTAQDTRERLVKLFLRGHLEQDQRNLHQKIAAEKGLIVPAEPGTAATPAPAAATPAGATPAAAPAPTAQPAPAQPASTGAKADTPAPNERLARSQPTTVGGKATVSAKAGPEETKAPAPAPAAPAGGQPTAQPAGATAPAAGATPAAPAAGAVPAAAPAAGATPAAPAGAAAAAAAQPAAQQTTLVFCKTLPCTDEEVTALYDLQLLNIRTFLTDPKLGYDACRTAYLADLEADQRRIIDEQLKVIEERRQAEAAAAAAAAAGRRGGATEPVTAPPPEVPFAPNREFDLGKYPACATFFQKGQDAITNEVNGKIFSTLGFQAAAYAYRQIGDLTRLKVEFVWLIDQQTGRGIAKNSEFSKDTADRYYYQKTIGEVFEGLSGANGTKVVEQVRAGTIYRDVWVTREELGDALTGFVHVAMVPVLGPAGNTVGLLVAAVRMENFARIARAGQAKLLVVRKVTRQGAESVQVIGDGNDDEKVEALPEGFRKKILLTRDADLRAVAGIDPLDKNGKGVRPSRDFDYDGTAYLAKVTGVLNAAGGVARGDTSFAVGPLALVVLVDKTAALDTLSSITQVWIYTGIAFLIALIAALILGSSFLRPIAQIEDGLLRIMNGDWTHRFEVRSSELGGLSYRINQLMAALLGDEEEGEMDGGEAEAAVDPREGYYQQLYTKFQDAQRQLKQDPGSVSYADFRTKLADNERKILEKNPGKQVEFEILVQGNQITFKPIVK